MLLYIILIFYSLSTILSITLKKLYICAYVCMPRHVPMRMCVHECTKRSEVNLRCCSLGNVLFLWQSLSPVWGLSSRLPGQWASGTSLNSQLGLLAVQIQEDPWSSLGFVADVVLRNGGPHVWCGWHLTAWAASNSALCLNLDGCWDKYDIDTIDWPELGLCCFLVMGMFALLK